MKQKKNKTAHGCLQFLAALVVIAFICAAVPAILAVSFSRTFANPENIKSAISLDSIVREFMTRAIEEDIRQKYFELNLLPPHIDIGNLRRAVDLVVPPDWIDSATDDGIDNIYNFLKYGRTDDYFVNLMPLLKTMQSEAGRESMTIIVAYYPPCPPEYIPRFEYKKQNVGIPCLPSDRPVAETANQIYNTLVTGLSNDPVIIAGNSEPLTWPPMDPDVVFYIRRTFQILDQLWLLWLIPLGLLVLIAILAVRSLYSLGLWFGSPLFLTGLIAPVAGWIVRGQLINWLQSLLVQLGPAEDEMSRLMVQFFIRLVASLLNSWLQGVYLQAAGMIVFGLGGLFLAICLKILTSQILIGSKAKQKRSLLTQ